MNADDLAQEWIPPPGNAAERPASPSADAASAANPTSVAVAPPRRRVARVSAVLLVIVLTVAAACFGWSCYRTIPLRDLPDINLSDAVPAVRGVIVDARNGVLASPRSGAAWGKLGLCLQAHKFDFQAAVCLATAMRLDPTEVSWAYNRGTILSSSDRSEAERCFRLASRLGPELSLPHFRLAEIFLEQRRLVEAEAEFREAIRIEPESARAMLGLGMIAFTRGDVEAAGQWASESFTRDPRQRKTAELLLRVFHRQGNQVAAARQRAIIARLPEHGAGWSDPIEERVARMRRDPQGAIEFALQLLYQNRLREATDLFEQLASTLPENSQLPTLLAIALIQQGEYGRAAEVLDAALARHPDSAEVHLYRGSVHVHERQWESAAAEFRRAIELKPDFADAYQDLGLTFERLNDREAAIAALREAVRFRPNFAEAYANLGRLLLESGEREAARQALETAASLSPEDRRTQQWLEKSQ